MKKCVHVVIIGDRYLADLRKLTLPTIEQYAEKIGAHLNIINTKQFLEFPIPYEKFQIYEMGQSYDWNVCIDLDTFIHPDLYDVTLQYAKSMVSFNFSYHADAQLILDKYFMRDGRNVGVATNFVVTSNWTHDFWEPLDISIDEVKKYVIRPHIIDEYCASRNLAKYGLKYAGTAPTPETQQLIFHVGAENQTEEVSIQRVLEYKKRHNI
jgi:hypothetical protein